jgi:phage shock protein A
MFYQTLPTVPIVACLEFSHRRIFNHPRSEVNTMALITRISRLFQADFHAVLDRIEEPDIQLKQAIREMQLDLQQSEQRLALLQHESEGLTSLAAEANAKLGAFDEELDICFTAKKEDLARDLIKRKLEVTRQLQSSEKQNVALKSSIQNLELSIEENHEQLENMIQKLELLVSDSVSVHGHQASVSPGVRSEEIEIAFLREKQKRAAS